MKKIFNLKEDHLEVEVTHTDKINLPINGSQTEIGTYDQKTIQKIDKDKVDILKDFIGDAKETVEKQIAGLELEAEKLKDVQMIDENVVEACAKVIGKGTKIFKQKMLALSTHIESVRKKKSVTSQLEFLGKQSADISKEYEDIQKALA